MNKKLVTICLIAALLLCLVCSASCKDESADRLRQINAAYLREYSQIKLNVKTQKNDIELNALYVLTKSDRNTDIYYEVERLNAFGTDGSVPSEFKTTVKGNATFNGSEITSINGDMEMHDVPLDAVTARMTFRLSFFKNLKVTSNGMSAKVINVKGFWNDDEFNGTDMTVKVVLKESYLSSIEIAYVLDGAEVSMTYAFTR